MPWDLSFYASRLREIEFGINEEELKQYFPLPHVLQGLFELTHELFGVTIEASHHPVQVWHEDVTYYIVKDEMGAQIASFYIDPYSRPEAKRGGAWIHPCVNRYLTDNHVELPVAFLNCNASPPSGTTPALLSFRNVETFFHEFGHSLQHLLTDVDYPSVSGISGIEWDAVEMASQFMENWCYDEATLKRISSHIDTGAPLPDRMIKEIQRGRTFLSATSTLRQLRLSLTDLALHSTFDPNGEKSPFDLYHEITQETSHIYHFPEDRFLCTFHHLFDSEDYAAGYYSYRWAEVMSADAFEAFLEEGNYRKTGERFKRTFLSLGGSIDPLSVFIKFRGREPSLEPYLRVAGIE